MKKVFAILLTVMMVFTMMSPAYAAGETEADAIAALMQECGLTGATYHKNGSAVPTAMRIDEQGRLVVTAGGTGGNVHLSADLSFLEAPLTDYTLEVKMTGIDVADGWHYGIGVNNNQDNALNTYFTVRSGAYTASKNYGTLMCYFKSDGGTASDTQNLLGKPDTAFADMSAAIGETNVISVTYSSAAKTMSYKINGVDVVTLTNTNADMTLGDFCLIVPYTKTVAFSYMKVMDGEGNVVYNNDFSKYNKNMEYVGTAIRFDDPSGIRVKSSICESLRTATVAEDGFKVVEYGTLVALGDSFAETAMTVGAAGVHKAIAYSTANDTDTFFSRDAEKTVYTVVLHNITDANQQYAFRAYYVVEYADGSTQTVYQTYENSANLIKTLSGVAQQIKDANGTDYTNHKDFIDGILAQVAE